MSDDFHQDNATQALDRIRTGGSKLVLTAHQRLAEIKRALDHGHFTEAFSVCHSLQEKLGHLAGAQGGLGRLADATIVKVDDLEPGMMLLDVGVVATISGCPHCGNEQCDNRGITFEGGAAVVLDCDDEVAVAHPEE